MVTYDLGKVVGDKGAKGDKGDKGDTGSTGATGNGISSIALVSTSGKVKTYRITYTNGDHFDFNVTDGADGALDVQTSWGSPLSDTKVPSEKLTKNSLDGKSDTNHTHSGYATSTHTHGNISNAGKIGSTANKPVITGTGGELTVGSFGTSANSFCEGNDSRLSDSRTPTSHTHGNLKNDGSVGSSNNASKNVVTDSNGKITTEAKPTIPSSSSDLSDGSDLLKKSNTSGLVKNDGSIDTSSYLTTGAASSTYVAKETGKGLFSGSYNDLTNKPSIPSDVSDLTDSSGVIPTDVSDLTDSNNTAFTPKSHTHGNLQNDGKVGSSNNASKNVVTDSNGKITTEDKPTIPSKISDLTNDSDFIETSETAGLIKNDGTIDTTSYSTFSGSYSDLTNKPSIPSKTSDLTNDGDGTNVFVKNNDSRLSDSRTPTAHTHTKSQITDFPSIPSKISDLTNDSDFIETSETAGLVKNDGTIDTTSYSTFSGDYDDLTDKPSIPSSSSDLSDGASLVKTSSTTGLLKNDGSVMSSGTGASNWAVGNHTHSGYVSATKVTSWSSTVSDSNVPSEKLVKDTLDELDALIGDAISYINQ